MALVSSASLQSASMLGLMTYWKYRADSSGVLPSRFSPTNSPLTR